MKKPILNEYERSLRRLNLNYTAEVLDGHRCLKTEYALNILKKLVDKTTVMDVIYTKYNLEPKLHQPATYYVQCPACDMMLDDKYIPKDRSGLEDNELQPSCVFCTQILDWYRDTDTDTDTE